MFNTNEKGGWIIPDNTVIPNDTIIPAYSELGNYCNLGDYCELGNYCNLGDWCNLGDYCNLGNYCKLGNYCNLGYSCKLGDSCNLGNSCSWLGVTVKKFILLSCIDGTGRQIKIVKSIYNNLVIEAGCFVGSIRDFVIKSERENKPYYAAIIPAVCNALLSVNP